MKLLRAIALTPGQLDIFEQRPAFLRRDVFDFLLWVRTSSIIGGRSLCLCRSLPVPWSVGRMKFRLFAVFVVACSSVALSGDEDGKQTTV